MVHGNNCSQFRHFSQVSMWFFKCSLLPNSVILMLHLDRLCWSVAHWIGRVSLQKQNLRPSQLYWTDWNSTSSFLLSFLRSILFGLTYPFYHSQVNLPAMRGLKLIRLRNPHGNSSEWKGAWSDRWQSQTKKGQRSRIPILACIIKPVKETHFWAKY